MRVSYFGHACFLIECDNFSVVIDPFTDIGYQLKEISADFCLCSHCHFDHNATHCVNVKEIIDESNISKFSWVRAVDSYHDEVQGEKRGKNTIFVLDICGVKICHMGDLGQPYTRDLVEKIGKVDLLLVPVGGNYTIDASNAAKYAMVLSPSIIIPMHYKTPRSNIDIAEKHDFFKYFNIVEKKDVSFEIAIPQYTTVYDINDDNF